MDHTHFRLPVVNGDATFNIVHGNQINLTIVTQQVQHINTRLETLEQRQTYTSRQDLTDVSAELSEIIMAIHQRPNDAKSENTPELQALIDQLKREVQRALDLDHIVPIQPPSVVSRSSAALAFSSGSNHSAYSWRSIDNYFIDTESDLDEDGLSACLRKLNDGPLAPPRKSFPSGAYAYSSSSSMGYSISSEPGSHPNLSQTRRMESVAEVYPFKDTDWRHIAERDGDWSEEKTLRGHIEGVHSISISPDGKRIASGSSDNTVRIWDISRGQQILDRFTGHTNSVRSVIFTPDGGRVVSGSDDGSLRTWDIATGLQIGEPLNGHISRFNTVAFSRDVTQAVSCSSGQSIQMWDLVRSQRIQKSFSTAFLEMITVVALSPDGSRVASGSNIGALRIWNLETGTSLERQKRQAEDSAEVIISMTFSPNGEMIALGWGDGDIWLCDATTGGNVGEPLRQMYSREISSMAFSSDGSELVSASVDPIVRIWDITKREQIGQLVGHTGAVNSVAVSPIASQIVSGSDDGTIRIWNRN